MVRPWISRDSVVVVAAVSAAAIVAVPLLQNGYARQAIEDRRWEDAERLAPLSAEVLSRKAEAAFASRDVPLAQRLAVAALRRAPLDVRALRILGLTAQRNNDRLRAQGMPVDKLIEGDSAGATGPRSSGYSHKRCLPAISRPHCSALMHCFVRADRGR